jgi:hypothetical protein
MTDEINQLVLETTKAGQYEVARRVIILRSSYQILLTNYQELKAYLARLKTFQFADTVPPPSRVRQMEEMEAQLARLLHNYVAAVKSLVDRTRHYMKEWYEGTDFLDEYLVEVRSRFENNPLAGFVEQLREYLLHYHLPSLTLFVESSGGLDDLHFGVLSKFELLGWQGWTNKKGKPFLQAADENIALSEVIEDYQRQVYEFHTWMRQRMEQLHHEEINWLADRQAQIEKLAVAYWETQRAKRPAIEKAARARKRHKHRK